MKKFISAIMLSSCVLLASFNSNAEECGFQNPDNYEQGKDIGGFDKDASVKQGQKDTENPLGVLMTCAFAITKGGMNPLTLIETTKCACSDAVKTFCKVKLGVLIPKNSDGVGLCPVFQPLAAAGIIR